MGDKYKIGVYGFWIFRIKRLLFEHYYNTYFEMYGDVIAIDEKAVTIKDCYDFTYRIVWDRLIKFEKQDKPECKENEEKFA